MSRIIAKETIALYTGLWLLVSPLLASALADPPPGPPAACQLAPMEQVLNQPLVRLDTRRQPALAYRRALTRFVEQHYSKLARDIARQEGSYLQALQVMLGTERGSEAACRQLLREMLVETQGSRGLAQAVVLQRFASPADEPGDTETFAVP